MIFLILVTLALVALALPVTGARLEIVHGEALVLAQTAAAVLSRPAGIALALSAAASAVIRAKVSLGVPDTVLVIALTVLASAGEKETVINSKYHTYLKIQPLYTIF